MVQAVLSMSAVGQEEGHTEQINECVIREQINVEQIQNSISNNWKEFQVTIILVQCSKPLVIYGFSFPKWKLQNYLSQRAPFKQNNSTYVTFPLLSKQLIAYLGVGKNTNFFSYSFGG